MDEVILVEMLTERKKETNRTYTKLSNVFVGILSMSVRMSAFSVPDQASSGKDIVVTPGGFVGPTS